MQQRTHLMLSLFLPLLYTTSSFSSIPSTDTFVYGGCSQLKYGPGSSYQLNVNSLLTSLLSSSSFAAYNSSTYPGQDSSPLYGLYQCRGDVSTSDCYRCVQAAISQIGVLCSGSCGGAIQLQGCFVKYDNATFIGAPDRTMVANKCGPVTSGSGTDLLSRRDEVLTELGSRSGSFRVSTVGYVSGMAQCVGDLSAAECADCLSEAIERVRGGCGASLSGDVYLGKCYVRYTASGVYGKAGNDSEDEAGKTLAIIIGLLAGVALIILFLSFLRKVFEAGKGG
ncbi:hypothetical protein MRB53_029974 [Persea americana]|uniref:Uncharacterized protein n=1 Tax=Persea americana TaxID=3435 RepID=A0ACC2KKB0_PERAE|nr:hypothetical protein MRB53_029974 [Persea americana]